MKTALFDFHLPPERIAQHAIEPRDAARLLVVRPGGLDDRVIHDLPGLLQTGDVLVLNDTKVIPARLRGRRGEAGIGLNLHMPTADSSIWHAFARNAKRLKTGDSIRFADDFSAEVIEKRDAGEVVLRFDAADLPAALERHGEMPLPPYIRREQAQASDAERYQTVFAARPGAVAAPTAGLHFTPGLMQRLEAGGAGFEKLTLHVGAGTFLPVTAEDTAGHKMHSEWAELSAETAARLNAARAAGRRIVAVGTTALRTLESAADEAGIFHPMRRATDIFITPGYRFRGVDLLLTNFHLPRSTLFMLVSAFSGLDRMQSAYRYAIDSGYRFYSYGDACLLYPAP